MPKLLPYRQYTEQNVIANLFMYSGNYPVNNGTFVKAAGNGAQIGSQLAIIGNAGASYTNTVSTRWGMTDPVVIASTGDQVLGMLLFDGREVDENGELLKWNPRKAAEMEVFLSGQSCPIVTKGIFQYSGDGRFEGTVTAGAKAYVSGGSLVVGNYNNASNHVGVFLGVTGANNQVLVSLNIVN